MSEQAKLKIYAIAYGKRLKLRVCMGPSIKDVRIKGEGVCQKRTFADVGEGVGEMRTCAKFWGFSTKFNINLDKNF